MRNLAQAVAWAFLVIATASGLAHAYSVPKDQQDQQKVYCGSLDKFDKPAEVDYMAIVQATPEYKKITKDNLDRGTGQYWILMEKASQRALRAIASFGKESGYDLVAAAGYLGGLNPPITAENVTEQVIEAMKKE